MAMAKHKVKITGRGSGAGTIKRVGVRTVKTKSSAASALTAARHGRADDLQAPGTKGAGAAKRKAGGPEKLFALIDAQVADIIRLRAENDALSVQLREEIAKLRTV